MRAMTHAGFQLFGVLSLAIVGSVAACSGDAGEAGIPGAAGSAGPAGAQGAAGPAGSAGAAPVEAGAPTAPPAVYVLSNDKTSNSVVVYARGADGSLSPFGTYATGGLGTSAALGNQGGLVFDAAHERLFAVNAGDDSISMLALRPDGSLTLVSKIGSRGSRPVSLTVAGDVLYVVNAGVDAGDVANISGFRIAQAGLTAIAGSTQPLSSATPGPAQIQFSPDGKVLVVTEKATDMIDTYVVTAGVAAAPSPQPSSGQTPFGFAFTSNGTLVVSEASGAAAGAGSVSTYALSADGTLTLKDHAAGQQSAACWTVVVGARAFVANTLSNTVSGYTVDKDGKLTSPSLTDVGMRPGEEAVTVGGDFLYTLNGGERALSVLAVAPGGVLTRKPEFVGLPEFSSGLIAR